MFLNARQDMGGYSDSTEARDDELSIADKACLRNAHLEIMLNMLRYMKQ